MFFKKILRQLFDSLIRNSLIYSYYVSLSQQKQKQLISQWTLASKQNIKLFLKCRKKLNRINFNTSLKKSNFKKTKFKKNKKCLFF